MGDEQIHYRETRYGFEYGAVGVSRVWSHNGACCIALESAKGGRVEVRVTPTGFMRVRANDGPEYEPVGPKLEKRP